MLEIEVHGIRGNCPVYKMGNKMVIDGPETVLEKMDTVCVHALLTLLHYVVAFEEGVDPVKLGLTKPEEKEYAYMQYVSEKYVLFYGWR